MTSEQKINEELKKYLAGSIEEIKGALQDEILGIDWDNETNGVYKINTDDTDFSEKLERFDSNLPIPSYCCCNGNPIWRVKLSSNPSPFFYNKFIKGKKVVLGKFRHTNQVHRGHYIAKRFEKYLVEKKNRGRKAYRTNHFFGKGNKCNIYYQSAESNCNSDTIHGQLFYENLVCKYLENKEENNQDKHVFYEIEDIRKPGQKEVSLGRRILIIFSEPKKDEYENVHVFIPNIYNTTVNITEPER